MIFFIVVVIMRYNIRQPARGPHHDALHHCVTDARPSTLLSGLGRASCGALSGAACSPCAPLEATFRASGGSSGIGASGIIASGGGSLTCRALAISLQGLGQGDIGLQPKQRWGRWVWEGSLGERGLVREAHRGEKLGERSLGRET